MLFSLKSALFFLILNPCFRPIDPLFDCCLITAVEPLTTIRHSQTIITENLRVLSSNTQLGIADKITLSSLPKWYQIPAALLSGNASLCPYCQALSPLWLPGIHGAMPSVSEWTNPLEKNLLQGIALDLWLLEEEGALEISCISSDMATPSRLRQRKQRIARAGMSSTMSLFVAWWIFGCFSYYSKSSL